MSRIDAMRKLAVFALLSLMVHLAIVADFSLPLRQHADLPPTLSVRLQPAAPPPPMLPRPHATAAKPAPTTESVAAATPAPAPTENLPVVAEPPPAVPAATAAAPAAKPAAALARRLPRSGEITYQLLVGDNRFHVGRTVQSWTLNDDHYRVTSASETTGVAALFNRQSIEYVSSGRLTAGGLRPDSFSNERQRSGKKDVARARFDWSAQTITFGEPPKSAPLADDAQDLVSFMYQLGLLPLTPGRIEMPITNGWKFERYELDIGAEEALQTPFGDLRAVPVKQLRRANEESIELWLAPAYRWLPVRIRFFDREGGPSGEQIVSDIKVSEN